jgi:hypothetical protein
LDVSVVTAAVAVPKVDCGDNGVCGNEDPIRVTIDRFLCLTAADINVTDQHRHLGQNPRTYLLVNNPTCRPLVTTKMVIDWRFGIAQGGWDIFWFVVDM